MPPKFIVSKDQVIAATANLISDKGFNSLNARSLATALNCSAKPIFRIYENMEQLKHDALVYLSKQMWEEITIANNYLQFAINYVCFAEDKANVFKALFMSNAINQSMIEEMIKVDDVRRYMAEIERQGVSRESAEKIYLRMWFFLHGLASMVSSNSGAIGSQQIRQMVSETYNNFIVSAKVEE